MGFNSAFKGLILSLSQRLGGHHVLPLQQHFVSQIRLNLSLLDLVKVSPALQVVCPQSCIKHFVNYGLCETAGNEIHCPRAVCSIVTVSG